MNQVLGQSREVRLNLGEGEDELRGEVAVGDRIERVLGHRGETEGAGKRLPLQGKGGPGEST